LELGVIRVDVGRAARITTLCGLAISKVAVLLLFFMQLRTESRALKVAVAVPLVLAPAFAIVLMLEAVHRISVAP
jgi:heme/copper-type cytochrome/quinol oxidase subunit 4